MSELSIAESIKQDYEEEIERLEKRNKEIYEGFMATQEELKEYAVENERLQNIIKEVRNRTIKMIANSGLDFMYRQAYKDILEILDKENVKAIPPEVIGTNGEDGGLFDYGDKGE